MNRFVLCIIGWLMCFVSVAQQTSAETEQDESNKIIQVEFRSDPRSGDTIHVKCSYSFDLLDGVFFKRMSKNEIKIPSTGYKDRYLKYEGGEIVNCTIRQDEIFSGRVYIRDMDLSVKPTDKKVTLTVTSKTGELLGKIDVLITPKISLYMKINKEMIELNSSLPVPVVKMDDVIRIVAITDKGEVLTTKECYVIKLDRPMCGNVPRTNGGELSVDDKEGLINPGRGVYVGGAFADKDGVIYSQFTLLTTEP